MKYLIPFLTVFLCHFLTADANDNFIDPSCESDPCAYQKTIQLNAPNLLDLSCVAEKSSCELESMAGPIGYQPLFTSSNFIQPINTKLAVGHTAGTHGVSPTGGATYSIPIFVSPGTGTMQPNVSLDYNSQSGNGSIGMGWKISGLSVITRTAKSLHYDGKAEPIKWDHSDKFNLDGSRLKFHSGGYGLDGSEYRTEVESFSKITSHGQRGNGPAYFKVETKDGMIMEYGNSYSSHLENDSGTETMLWRLNRVTELSTGNYMIYDYDNAGNDSRLKSIKYTGNSNTYMAPYNSINFLYANRDTDEYNTVWIGGQDLNLRKLLVGIEVVSNGTVGRKYKLAYGKNQYSYLNEVTEFGMNDDPLNSTKFLYGGLNGATYKRVEPISNYATQDFFPGDFNGDGYSDLCAAYYEFQGTGNNRIKQYVSFLIKINDKNGGYQTAGGGPLPQGCVVVGSGDEEGLNQGPPTLSDFNGDGKDDIMFAKVNADHELELLKFFFYESPYNLTEHDIVPSFQTSNGLAHKVSVLQNHNFLQVGDFDADGSADILAFLSNGTNGPKPFLFFPRFSDDQYPVTNLTFSQYDMTRMLPLNFDDDGKSDLLIVNDDGQHSKIFSFKKLQNDEVAAHEVYSNLYPSKWHRFYPGDFNGDGKTDLFITNNENSNGWQISYATGEGFLSHNFGHSSSAWLNDLYPLQAKTRIGDFNGDGKSDIFYVRNTIDPNTYLDINEQHLYISSGANNFKLETNTSSGSFPHYAQVLDDNGDGTSDIIAYREDFAYQMIKTFNAYRDVDQLVSVQNGFGLVTSFQYSRLTDENIYNREATQLSYPTKYIIGASLKAVKAVVAPDGIGGTTTSTYKYTDALMNRRGKGFIGFRKLTTKDSFTGVSMVSSFKYWPSHYLFTPQTTEIFNAGNILIDRSTQLFDIQSLASSTYWPHLIDQTDENFLTGKITNQSLVYDDYGNTTESIIKKGTGSSAEVTKVNTIYSQENTWIPASPKEIVKDVKITTSSLSPNYIRKTLFSYYSNGLLKKEIKDPFTSKSLITRNYYNNQGNVIRIETLSPGTTARDMQFEYDSQGRFTTKEINVNGDEKKYKYHGIWGVVKSESDVNGHAQHSDYDNFGRLISTKDKLERITKIYRTWSSGNGIASPTTVGNATYKTKVVALGVPESTEWFDAFGRSLGTKTESLTAPIMNVTTYDKRGNIKTSTASFFEFDNQNAVVSTNTYDSYNRLISRSNDDGTSNITYSLASNYFITKTTKPNGETKYEYKNGAGRLTKSKDLGGTLHYSYSSTGSPRKIYNTSSGNSNTMTYDAYGVQTSLYDANAGTTQYNYNAWGELVKQIDPNGNVTEMQYDNLGRVIKEITPDGENILTYVNGTNGKNKLESIVGANGISKQYLYDEYSRVTKMSEYIDGESFDYYFTYDNLSRLNTMTYPSGYSIQNTYDAETGIRTTIRKEGAGKKDILFHLKEINALGQYISFNLGNNITTNRTYNKYGLLTSSVAGNLHNMIYKYNNSTGNMTSRQNNLMNLRERFHYDQMDRLIKSKVTNLNYPSLYIAQVDLTFSQSGNISTKSDVGDYGYHSAKRNAVVSINNPTSNIPLMQQDVVYTHFDKTASIAEGDFAVNVTYGPEKSRKKVEMVNGQDVITRYYSNEYEKIILANQDVIEINYIPTGEGLNVMVVLENGVEKEYYVYTDHNGSVLTITDESGVSQGEQSFDAWGRYRKVNGWNYGNAVSTMPDWFIRGYTGHEHYADVGLINMNGRVYDPLVGRMLSVDNYVQNATNTQTFNRYTYAHNNPLKYTDPDGENPVVVAAIIIGGITGAYIGGAAANGWEYNPGKWDWGAGSTWAGIGIGAVIGAASGLAAAKAGAFLAKPAILGSINGGTSAAYFIAGGSSFAVGGYLAGYLGWRVGGGNPFYAHDSGKIGATIGFNIGSIVGTLYGLIAGRSPAPKNTAMALPEIEPALIASNDAKYYNFYETYHLTPGTYNEITIREVTHFSGGEGITAGYGYLEFSVSNTSPSALAGQTVRTASGFSTGYGMGGPADLWKDVSGPLIVNKDMAGASLLEIFGATARVEAFSVGIFKNWTHLYAYNYQGEQIWESYMWGGFLGASWEKYEYDVTWD